MPATQRGNLVARLAEYWPMMNMFRAVSFTIEFCTVVVFMAIVITFILAKINKQVLLKCSRHFAYCLEFMVPITFGCGIDDHRGITGDLQRVTSICTNNLHRVYKQIIFVIFVYISSVLVLITLHITVWICTLLCKCATRLVLLNKVIIVYAPS